MGIAVPRNCIMLSETVVKSSLTGGWEVRMLEGKRDYLRGLPHRGHVLLTFHLNLPKCGS